MRRSKKIATDENGTSISSVAKRYSKALEDIPTAAVLGEGDEAGVVPFGLPVVDWGVLGIGGLPFNRAVEVYGGEGSGKTRLCIRLMSRFLKLFPEEEGLWVDSEGSHVIEWFQKGGVDLKRMRLAFGMGFGESYIKTVYAALASGIRCIIIDSVASLFPREVGETDNTNPNMREKLLQAGLVSNFLGELEAGNPKAGRPPLSKSNAMIIFINHVRPAMKENTYYEESKGAQRLKHVCRIRLNVERRRLIRYGEDGKEAKEGAFTPSYKPAADEGTFRLMCMKNQHAPPMGSSMVHIGLKSGRMWDDPESVLRYGELLGRITVGGSWITWKDKRWQGIDAFREYIMEKPSIVKLICAPQEL